MSDLDEGSSRPGSPVSHLPQIPLLLVPGAIQQEEGETHLEGDVWDDEQKSRLLPGQGMNQVTGQTASPLEIPASDLPWPTLLGSRFLEPGLPQVSSPSMTQV